MAGREAWPSPSKGLGTWIANQPRFLDLSTSPGHWENSIFSYWSLDCLYGKNEKNSIIIGENNIIREYVTINPGTEGGGGKTIVGNNCLFMISSHIAHDCNVGNNVIIANNVPLGGHVTIEDSVVIGGNSAVQQHTRIGRLAMIGGMTGVLKDVIPFGLSIGNRNHLQGLNLIGLRRKNYENKKIIDLDKAYKKIFSSKNLHENLSKIKNEYKDNELVNEVINFIAKDKRRPICLPINQK